MQLSLPSSEHPQVQVETVTPDATLTTTVDKSHKVAEIALPEGTDESLVEHWAQFLNSRGQAVGEKLAYVKGAWESAAKAAEEKAKEEAKAAEQKAKAAADALKAKADKAKAKVEAKVEAHKTEISAAVATAEIAAEVAGK